MPVALAVYGLLRPEAQTRSAGPPPAVRIALHPVGPCRIAGRLIDLGDYPALILGRGHDHGGVSAWLMRLAPWSWPIIDAYEDHHAAAPARSLYVRRRVKLLQPKIWAWTYVWRGAGEAGPHIASGDWLAR